MLGTRKIAGVLIATLFLGIVAAGVASAAEEKAGVLDSDRALHEHPKYAQTQEQLRTISNKKLDEAQAKIEKETDNSKKAEIFQNARKEIIDEERKLMQPLFDDVEQAIREVAKAKQFTVILDKTAIFYGGVDITDDVVQELRRKNASS
ncbi:MAG: OmpH family outer membrane protein [Synergistaceae bacterium]|jgi:outer membrane protein|nr:OmpH family outer membrane protein [Synergistaceae bacterium]